MKLQTSISLFFQIKLLSKLNRKYSIYLRLQLWTLQTKVLLYSRLYNRQIPNSRIVRLLSPQQRTIFNNLYNKWIILSRVMLAVVLVVLDCLWMTIRFNCNNFGSKSKKFGTFSWLLLEYSGFCRMLLLQSYQIHR